MAIEDVLRGCILADDMGLGKTPFAVSHIACTAGMAPKMLLLLQISTTQRPQMIKKTIIQVLHQTKLYRKVKDTIIQALYPTKLYRKVKKKDVLPPIILLLLQLSTTQSPQTIKDTTYQPSRWTTLTMGRVSRGRSGWHWEGGLIMRWEEGGTDDRLTTYTERPAFSKNPVSFSQQLCINSPSNSIVPTRLGVAGVPCQ